jgi:arylsulfatase
MGKPFNRDDALYFEHEGNRAITKGRWKLVAGKGEEWELYDLENDRTETRDLAAQMPEKADELAALYEAWARRCFVNKTRKR